MKNVKHLVLVVLLLTTCIFVTYAQESQTMKLLTLKKDSARAGRDER